MASLYHARLITHSWTVREVLAVHIIDVPVALVVEMPLQVKKLVLYTPFTLGFSLPVFRVLDLQGQVIPTAQGLLCDVDSSVLLRMLNVMVETEQTERVYSQWPLFKESGAYMLNTGEKGLQAALPHWSPREQC